MENRHVQPPSLSPRRCIHLHPCLARRRCSRCSRSCEGDESRAEQRTAALSDPASRFSNVSGWNLSRHISSDLLKEGRKEASLSSDFFCYGGVGNPSEEQDYCQDSLFPSGLICLFEGLGPWRICPTRVQGHAMPVEEDCSNPNDMEGCPSPISGSSTPVQFSSLATKTHRSKQVAYSRSKVSSVQLLHCVRPRLQFSKMHGSDDLVPLFVWCWRHWD